MFLECPTPGLRAGIKNAECPSTQHLRSLVAKTIPGMILETRDLRCSVLEASGEADRAEFRVDADSWACCPSPRTCYLKGALESLLFGYLGG